jgi:hypothetical protein
VDASFLSPIAPLKKNLVPHPWYVLHLVQLVAPVIEAPIDDPALDTRIRQLMVGKRMMEALRPPELFQLLPASNLNERPRREFRGICALCPAHRSKNSAFLRWPSEVPEPLNQAG